MKRDNKFKEGTMLYFYVHGFFQKGTFIKDLSDSVMVIKVAHDEFNPFKSGYETPILRAFLTQNMAHGSN